ncbi:MAG: hypothetical protein K8R40_09090 [Anaerolineaceae bacterium]|nr:hypothetical protein [Anaerolineaceae bacterium]
MYELYLLPMHRENGLEQNQLQGFFPVLAPKRCQRSRIDDRLLLWLSFVTGGDQVADEELNEWLKDAARTYFNARGTITSGMRVIANYLNEKLLSRSTTLSQENGKIGAKLNMALLRGDDLYLAHAGAVYTFLLQDDKMIPYFNTNSHSQVLGYAEDIRPHFFQTKILLCDVLLLSPSPAQGWNRQTLTFEKRPSLQSVRRRLLNNTLGDFEALVLQLQSGEKGEFHKMRLANASGQAQQSPSEADSQEETAVSSIETVEADNQSVEESRQPKIVEEPEKTVDLETSTPDKESVVEPAVDESPDLPSEETEQNSDEQASQKKDSPQKPKVTFTSVVEKLPLPGFEESKRRFAKAWVKLRKLKDSPPSRMVTQPPLLPQTEDSDNPEGEEVQVAAPPEKKPQETHFKLPISNRILLLVAIAVPLIFAAIAGATYLKMGVEEQFAYYYERARQISGEAIGETDSEVKRTRLENALQYLERAETFRSNDDSRELRLQIEAALDDVDGVVRLELFNIIDSKLSASIEISKLFVLNQYDLFALDGNSGQVLHFIYDGQIYQLDDNFVCGGSGLEKFVDIAPLSPMNEKRASVIAIDAIGSITYCKINAEPENEMLKVPIFGWLNVTEMTMERNAIFTLDQGTRALWQYYGKSQIFTDEEPYLFFSQDPPLDLTQVKAMDVYSDTIVFVEESNQVMTCVVQAMTAEDRECFYLPPIDKQGSPISLQQMDWVDIYAADFPPSYYLLDQNSRTLYQFSVQMKLNKSFRFYAAGGDWLPKNDITAFTVTEQQNILVAFGNGIYLAQIK